MTICAGRSVSLVVAVTSCIGLLPAGPVAEDAAPATARVARSRQEVLELIEKEGSSHPAWWDEVRLEYPTTLDLTWPKPTGPWNTRKNVGQYLWSIVNENPHRWKQGTKFMHYVLAVNKERPEARLRAIQALAHCYHDLLEDWARAAYWLRKIERHNLHHVISLANCYWKLGNKDMARKQLERISVDSTRYGGVIKLWSDLGEIKKALELVEATVLAGRKDAAYMGAGDACRKHGRPREALAFYEKVLALPEAGDNEILERNKKRARIHIDMIRLFETLDLESIPDGSYSGTSLAYNGDLSVSVQVREGHIESVRITEHKDKQYYSALSDIPRQIIEKQSLDDVDATTGATITAEAVVNATARALASASGNTAQ